MIFEGQPIDPCQPPPTNITDHNFFHFVVSPKAPNRHNNRPILRHLINGFHSVTKNVIEQNHQSKILSFLTIFHIQSPPPPTVRPPLAAFPLPSPTAASCHCSQPWLWWAGKFDGVDGCGDGRRRGACGVIVAAFVGR